MAGLGGALEIGGESSTNNLTPYTTNTQNVRRRYWDGIDKLFRADLQMIKGNHLFQFGGTYQRNFDAHQRDDNGQTSFADLTYISNKTGIVFPSAYIPAAIPTSQINLANVGYADLYAEVMGMVSVPQVVYVRGGGHLAVQSKRSVAPHHSIVSSVSGRLWQRRHMNTSLPLAFWRGRRV